MTHSLRGILFIVVLTCLVTSVQADDGWKLLFADSAQGLSDQDQLTIYQHLGLTRDVDGKGLLVMGDEEEGPARFKVKFEDINADGRSEVFVIGGNTFLSGATGSSVWMFMKPAPDANWQMNLGFPATAYTVLAQRSAGYPDLRFSGTGVCDAVWRWDGNAYEHHQDITTRSGGCDQPR